MENLYAILTFWAIAWVFNAGGDRILFRFNESVFNRIKNEKVRFWFRGDYKNKLKEKGWPAPFWDGWHAFKWLQWLFVYLAIGFQSIPAAIFFALTGMLVFLFFYNFVFSSTNK